MSLSVPKVLMLVLILASVGVVSGFRESNKENPNETSSLNESEIQQTAEALIQQLGAADINSRKEARFALEEMGERVVDPLIEVIDSEILEIRCEIALANARSQRAEKDLIQTLSDEDRRVRSSSAWALGEIARAGSSSKREDWKKLLKTTATKFEPLQ